MNAAVLMLALCVGSNEHLEGPITTDRVDMIEVNHNFDEQNNRLILSQIIYWEWSPYFSEFIVMHWQLIGEGKKHTVVRKGPNEYISIGFDDERLRVVKARSFKETWTYDDPEVVNQRLVPKNERIGLTHEVSEVDEFLDIFPPRP